MKAALIGLCLIAAGCGGRPGTERVRIANIGTGLQTLNLPIPLAQTLGYFREEGLEAELEGLPSNAKTMQALTGGSVDVAGITYLQTIQMAAEGQSVRSFFVQTQRLGAALAVTASGAGKIRRIEDLRGAVVGAPATGSPTYMILSHYLKSHGVAAEDLSVVSIGVSASAIAAAQSGRIDAAMFSGGDHFRLLRRSPGARILVDTSTPEGMMETLGVSAAPIGAVAARQEWLDRNPGTARKVARALARAQAWIAGHTAEEIRNQLPEGLRSPEAEEDLEIIRWSLPTFTVGGRMPKGGPEAMKKLLDATSEKVRSARIDLAATWTDEFLPEGK